MPKSKNQRALISVDLRQGLEAEILEAITAFPLFVQKMRSGDQEVGPIVVEHLIRSLQMADHERADIRLLAAFAVDLFYNRIAELDMMDGHTRDYCKAVVRLLFDQLRVRGVRAFYILDNEIPEERFVALTELAKVAGLSVVSPQLGPLSESESVHMINYQMTLRRHIFYVEPDAKFNYIDTIKAIPKSSDYVVAFRNQAPSVSQIEILSLGERA